MQPAIGGITNRTALAERFDLFRRERPGTSIRIRVAATQNRIRCVSRRPGLGNKRKPSSICCWSQTPYWRHDGLARNKWGQTPDVQGVRFLARGAFNPPLMHRQNVAQGRRFRRASRLVPRHDRQPPDFVIHHVVGGLPHRAVVVDEFQRPRNGSSMRLESAALRTRSNLAERVRTPVKDPSFVDHRISLVGGPVGS